MQSACCAHSILRVSTILDFWPHNFQATVIYTFVVHLHCINVIGNILKNQRVKFCGILPSNLNLSPTKSCAIFYMTGYIRDINAHSILDHCYELPV